MIEMLKNFAQFPLKIQQQVQNLAFVPVGDGTLLKPSQVHLF